MTCAGIAQQNALSAAQQESSGSHPELSHRPAPNPEAPQGEMKIDVVVTDEAGQPVGGLTQKDFTLFDNKKPRPILSFRAVDGSTGDGTRNDPPVEVILLLDVTNTPLDVVGHERGQIERFLRSNGGRLMQPTSLMIFNDQGVKGLPRPTRDGNQLADELTKAETTAHSVLLTEQTEPERVTMSLNALERISEAANTKAGRTLLIWIGPGWPMLENPNVLFTTHEYAAQFDRVVTISGEMRDARVTLYSIYPTDPAVTDEPRIQHYRSFLKGAASVNQVRPGNLALPVLAIHSGGRALDVPADLGDEIAACIAEAKSYYTLGFDPVKAKHVDEYHELGLRVHRPGLKVRSSAGYYGEPGFLFPLPALSGH
jgi:VWFA-related protein